MDARTKRQIDAYLMHEGVNIGGMTRSLKDALSSDISLDPLHDEAIGLMVYSIYTLSLFETNHDSAKVDLMRGAYNNRTHVQICELILDRCQTISREGGDTATTDHDLMIHVLLKMLHLKTFSKIFSHSAKDYFRVIQECKAVYLAERAKEKQHGA